MFYVCRTNRRCRSRRISLRVKVTALDARRFNRRRKRIHTHAYALLHNNYFMLLVSTPVEKVIITCRVNKTHSQHDFIYGLLHLWRGRSVRQNVVETILNTAAHAHQTWSRRCCGMLRRACNNTVSIMENIVDREGYCK